MGNELSSLMVGLLVFAGAISFWYGTSYWIGEVYYGRPPVEGLAALSSSESAEDLVINPFMSQVHTSEMVGTGSYQPYAAIPQMMSAITTLFNLPTVMLSILTTVGNYIYLPSWFTSMIFGVTGLLVAIYGAKVLLKEEM